MMDKILIEVHSIVDIITNSSTEMFVIDTNKSIETIKEILEHAIDLHNKSTNSNYTFDDIFKDITINSGNEALGDWTEYYKSNIDAGVIIEGSEDNSIPYWMFEFIESIFGYKTERFHLG